MAIPQDASIALPAISCNAVSSNCFSKAESRNKPCIRNDYPPVVNLHWLVMYSLLCDVRQGDNPDREQLPDARSRLRDTSARRVCLSGKATFANCSMSNSLSVS